MGKINMGRVLLGGLLAGLVFFFTEFVLQGVLLKGQWDAAMTALGRDPAAMKNSSAMMTYAAWSLIIGIVSVWFYAAARPRFGAGAGSAARVALGVWVAASLGPTLGNLAAGLWPARLLWCGTFGELPIYVIAIVVGAWPYTEA